MVKNKFNIGDHVIFKGTRGIKRRLFDFFGKPKNEEGVEVAAQVLRVTDILIETCYGGTQVHYMLRALTVGSDGYTFKDAAFVSVSKDLIKAREIELEAV